MKNVVFLKRISVLHRVNNWPSDLYVCSRFLRIVGLCISNEPSHWFWLKWVLCWKTRLLSTRPGILLIGFDLSGASDSKQASVYVLYLPRLVWFVKRDQTVFVEKSPFVSIQSLTLKCIRTGRINYKMMVYSREVYIYIHIYTKTGFKKVLRLNFTHSLDDNNRLVATPPPGESSITPQCQTSGLSDIPQYDTHKDMHSSGQNVNGIIRILINVFISCIHLFSSLGKKYLIPAFMLRWQHRCHLYCRVECHNSWRCCQGNGGQTSRGESVSMVIDIILSLSPPSPPPLPP